ncbi:aldose epimerase family protein [Rhodovulum sp. DZ06]|uniref:aldose epimerase family protein n=1 Tax=Rhodovulum sp. DZ06 TaxID=3425126 RepID=UPI003D358FAC
MSDAPGVAAPFGEAPSGPVQRIALEGGGLRLGLLTWGATVQDLRLEGVPHPLVLGAETLAPYLGPFSNMGNLVGRFANRIGGARLEIDGRAHALDRNFRGRHILHGGAGGSGAQVWRIEGTTPASARLSLHMPDGHMGFPGALDVTAAFSLPGDGVMRIEMEARTDAPTPCSFAHHGYFTLDGEADARGQRLRIDAEHVLEVDEDLVPTGRLLPVAGTRFDFRAARDLGPAGFDVNFCLRPGEGLREVAALTGRTGVEMRLATDAPGLQLYDGAHLPPEPGLAGRRYGPHAGVALEAQSWPDAPSHPHFPNSILRPGQVWRRVVEHRFSAPTRIG